MAADWCVNCLFASNDTCSNIVRYQKAGKYKDISIDRNSVTKLIPRSLLSLPIPPPHPTTSLFLSPFLWTLVKPQVAGYKEAPRMLYA